MKRNKFLQPLSPNNQARGSSIKRISGLGLSIETPKGQLTVKNSRRYTSARNNKFSPKECTPSSEIII